MTYTLDSNTELQSNSLAKRPPVTTKNSAVTNESSSSPLFDTESELEYRLLKRKIKEMTELNIAMSRDYFHAKKKIRALTFERNLLLDSIGRMENADNLTDDSDESDALSDLSFTDDEMGASSTYFNSKPKLNKKSTIKPTAVHNGYMADHHTATSTVAALTPITSPHKRSKLTPQSVKTRRVQPVERDQDGNPKLPQQIGVLTVHSLGKIITDRPNYHSERYIYPVGYSVSRTYPSMIDPNSNTVITSSILDGGEMPRYQVVAADMPNEKIVGSSATGVWTVVVRRSNEIRHREHSNSASGPDYYGFKHPTIAKMIQDLPGAKDLKNYVWQTFEEMEPRAAKGVMAAAEKKRGNLEQMGSANRKVPKADNGNVLVFHHSSMDDEVDELAASDKE